MIKYRTIIPYVPLVGFQSFEHQRQVIGNLGVKVHGLARDRMLKNKFVGM